MTVSPYSGKPESSWLGITQRLVRDHPLKLNVLLEAALATWDVLWQTTVGESPVSVRLADLKVPATVVGYFFEVLFARELSRRDPRWRGSQSKGEKDIVYVPDGSLSVEIKTSGQAGLKVFGNRSYGQETRSDLPATKEKSGFYVTVNFQNQTLTLIRFGWIDAEDWTPQRAPTGQMAGLKEAVYSSKLLPIGGSYRQQAPVSLLKGVGPTTSQEFANLDVHTIGDLLHYPKELPGRLARVRTDNQDFLKECEDTASPSVEKP